MYGVISYRIVGSIFIKVLTFDLDLFMLLCSIHELGVHIHYKCTLIEESECKS